LLLVVGILAQTFGRPTVTTQAAVGAGDSAGSVPSTGFGCLQKQPRSSPRMFFNASPLLQRFSLHLFYTVACSTLCRRKKFTSTIEV